MFLFKTIDDSGVESIHKCDNIEQAQQAHLLHYGLFSVNFSNVLTIQESEEGCNEKMCTDYIKELQLEGFGTKKI